ncbi:hypothetical protein IFM89_020030 [Coptis chinensis]|uniref:Uncharacterized protein n=1 Tax=Coptis chinensis TaxID=261450 RepID=A0A835MF08_9MAGN|nr:hypothetical protein IFM89_020030 [Coptis chinensis]
MVYQNDPRVLSLLIQNFKQRYKTTYHARTNISKYKGSLISGRTKTMETETYLERWRCLDGKVVMVTGASSGIGREYCLDLAKSGWTRIKSSVQKAWSAFGRIDALVNNAGVRGEVNSPLAVTEEEWDSVLRTNLTGSWLVSKYVCSFMCRAGQPGSIINISSIAGLCGGQLPGGVIYAVSKAAVNAMTRGAAVNLDVSTTNFKGEKKAEARILFEASLFCSTLEKTSRVSESIELKHEVEALRGQLAANERLSLNICKTSTRKPKRPIPGIRLGGGVERKMGDLRGGGNAGFEGELRNGY